ncbi:MAG: TrkA C-terminal domain-containing protein [Sulfobacillus sp.]
MALGDILVRKDMLVIDIVRGLDHLVPCSHTVLKFGDLLTIFCSRSQHHEIRDLFEGTLASEPNPDGY